jgi:enoyl-CoA hydratase
MSTGSPSLEVRNAVATIRLRRPEQANRIEAGDVGVLLDHCAAISADRSVRAVVLTAAGPQFSAGYDLTALRDKPAGGDEAESVSSPFEQAVNAFEALPQVTVCALNGGVYGGSIDLAMACDFRYGVSAARMRMPAARLVLQYYTSGMQRYVSRLGLDNAKRLFLLGETLDAQQMLAMGFLHAVVEPEQLVELAQSTAARAAGMAPLAVSGMKRALNAIASNSLDPEATQRSHVQTTRSQDFREGVAAWHEKREPTFRGM